MKKKIISAGIVVVVCFLCAFNYYVNVKSDAVSEQSLAQIEVLAGDGDTEGGNSKGKMSQLTDIICITDGEIGFIKHCV